MPEQEDISRINTYGLMKREIEDEEILEQPPPTHHVELPEREEITKISQKRPRLPQGFNTSGDPAMTKEGNFLKSK